MPDATVHQKSALAERLAQLPAGRREALRTLLEYKSAVGKPIPRRHPEDRVPLTYSQQRLWIVQSLFAGKTAYNQTNFISLPFELNVGAFHRALNEIVRRHEMLRSTIVEFDGEPFQQINPCLTLELPVIDLRAMPPDEREAEAYRRAAQESDRPFNLETGPLLRALLYRLDTASYLFMLTIHHIACDGWSMGVLAVELSTLYWSYVLGKPSPLLELPVQYGDFAVWQRRCLEGKMLQPFLAYWRSALSGISNLELPSDRPRPAQFTFRGARFPLSIEGELFQSLRTISEREGVSMHMTLLAALFVLLHKYSGQEDICIGVPTAGRNRIELEPLIGFFVNTLIMRVDLAGDPTFAELLARVRHVALDAYAHQDVPFERLVEELQPVRDLSRNALVQVMFQLFQPPSAAGIQREAVFAFVPAASGGSKFDLTVELVHHPDHVQGFVEYNTDLFDSDRIERLTRHFQSVLRDLLENLSRNISRLDLTTAEERQLTTFTWNATNVEYPRDSNVAAEFLRQVETNPNRTAVEFEGSQQSYAELRDRARAIAAELIRRGVSKGDGVGLLMERSLELPAAMLGILYVGAFYVALDPRYPSSRLAFLVADSGVRQIVTTRAQAETNPEYGTKLIFIEEIPAAGEVPFSPAAATGIACLLYTSGTTGTPKAVAVNHRNILRLVKNTRYIRYDQDDVVLQFSPITFDASLFEIWGSLLNGAKLVVHPPGMPLIEDLAAFIHSSGVGLLFLTTSLFRRVVEDAVRDLRHVRQIITGGEVIPAEVARTAWAHLPRTRIVNCYGPTECVTFSTSYEITGTHEIESVVPIGKPIENTTAYIVDSDMKPVPIGIPGELLIGGDAVANGYWNRPEASAKSFIANPFGEGVVYRTGDNARYRSDGNIEFLGRKDRQVKLNGHRIELGEVEAALLSCPGISAAAAIVLQTDKAKSDDGQSYLAAFAEPVAGQSLDAVEIRSRLKTILPHFMVPSRVEVVPRLPLTANGKIDLLSLAARADARDGTRHERVAPRTAIEKRIGDIWKDILHVPELGIDDDFFALGGQSLIATRVLSRLREAFQTHVTMREFFSNPTIRGLAAAVEQRTAGRSMEPSAASVGARE